MKKIISIVLVLLMSFAIAGCSKKGASSSFMTDNEKKAYSAMNKDYLEKITSNNTVDFSKEINVVMKVKDYGEIELELYPNIAPVTVANFVNLVQEGFYDGLTFHRIIDEFMIQGGDPDGNGMGGAPNNIVGEFSANGFTNALSHTAGVISMARSQDMNSASSQFFICDADAPHLDGQYAAFGKVVKGMDIVQEISECEVQYSCPACGNLFLNKEAKCPKCGQELGAYASSYKSSPVKPIVIESIKVK